MSPPQVTELFEQRGEHPYNLRHDTEFLHPLASSVCWGTESISYLDSRVWGMVPDTNKIIQSYSYSLCILYNFKKAIKKWKAGNCPCIICKVFIKKIGFCETLWIIIFLMPVVFYILNFLLYILKFKFQKVLLGNWRELACFCFYY